MSSPLIFLWLLIPLFIIVAILAAIGGTIYAGIKCKSTTGSVVIFTCLFLVLFGIFVGVRHVMVKVRADMREKMESMVIGVKTKHDLPVGTIISVDDLEGGFFVPAVDKSDYVTFDNMHTIVGKKVNVYLHEGAKILWAHFDDEGETEVETSDDNTENHQTVDP